MAQPYDYRIQVADPFTSVLEGYKTGLQMRDVEQKRAQAEAEMQRQQELQRRIQSVYGNPNATAEDYQGIAMLQPKEQADITLRVWESKDKAQKQGLLTFGGQVYSALRAKKPEIALQLLNDRITAERNSGNEDQAKSYETWASLVEKSPEFSEASIATFMAGLPGGKEVVESVISINKEVEDAKQRPLKTREMTAATIIKEAEAKFAPEQFLANLNLTKEQINQAKAAQAASKAAAAKSGAEAKALNAQAAQMAAGIIPADKRPEAESKFRKEYSDQTKGYQEVKSAYGRILASGDDAAGDIALIFNYMKMLDPGSVVREGEFATAQNAGGVPDRVVNLYNRALSGTRLNKDQRVMFKKQAEGLFNSAGKQEAEVRDGISRIATGYGLNLSNIFYTPTETKPGAPAPGMPAPAGAQSGVTSTPAASNINALLGKYGTKK